jgi:hypothetical protein
MNLREFIQSEIKSQLNKGKSFKSLKDIEVAIKHLIPNVKLEKGHSFPSLKIVGDGYIALDIPNSKKYVVIAYTRSEYGTGTTGVLWVYGDRHRGFEFTTIEELHSLLKKEADLKESVNEGVDWKAFYTMAKDTSGYNPSFEKKYGKLLDKPHVKDALDKTKDFNSFMKFIKKFESVNEGMYKKEGWLVKSNDDDTKYIVVHTSDVENKSNRISDIYKDKKLAIKRAAFLNKKLRGLDESILSEKKPSKIVWDTKKISAAKRINVRKWYMKTYPIDELGGEINQKLTLWDVYTYLSQGYDVYKIIGVSDSVIRERVFEKLSKVLDVDYDTIYNMFESVNEGIWPKSKLADRFEFILSDELKKNFKGIFYVVGYDLYHNDKKVMTINPDKDSVNSIVKTLKSKLKESVNEEQLDEKLITFSNRAPYGQVVFMAGGAGSGKGFAIKNFIDSAGFKVRDVDEMKTSLGKLDQLGKFSIDAWFKKYANKLSEEERAHVEEFVLGKGLNISDVASDLKNPNNVAALHYIVDAMGLKDSWLVNILSGKTNKETLPNLLFDITAKKVGSITEVTKPLIDAGYDSKNIHLIWVLTDYHLAVQQNKRRDRVVPDDILLNTHEGAAKTIWGILTSGLPSGLNGRIDIILNNRENTVTYKDSKGNEMKGAVKGFLSLPVKKQGGGVLPEKVWKETLYKWIVDNGPKTVDLRKPLDQQMVKK